MKNLIKRLIPGVVPIYNRVYNHLAHYRFKNLPIDQVFATIYKENHWGDNESRSGTGSNQTNTQSVVHIFSKIIEDFSIKLVLDVPCGDFNWTRNVDLRGIKYIGADIVQEVINDNNRRYSDSNVSFQNLNLVNASLPQVDLIFCRDCLVHFSYRDIRKALHSIKQSGSLYIATTTFPNHKNYDIITGDWRPLNLQSDPFNFPEPLFLQNENCLEGEMGRYKDKSLAVWRVSDIAPF